MISFNRLIVLAVLILVSGTLSAQNYLIEGQVLDAATGKTLAGATIVEKGNRNGVHSDEKGLFSLNFDNLPKTIRVSYLGYFTQELIVSSTESLQIQLKASDIEVPSVVINSSRLSTVHPNKKLNILDYQFMEDDLVMVVRNLREKKNRIEVMDVFGNLVDANLEMGEEPRGLYKDCMDVMHCLSKTYAWQLDWVENKLVARPDSLDRFHKVVDPCLAVVDSTYFFNAMNAPYMRHFVYIRTDERRKRHLYASIDSSAIETLQDEAEMPGRIVSAHLLGNSNRPEYTEFGLDPNSLRWMMVKPPYIPLIAVDDKAVVFDHLKNKMLYFDNKGQLVKEVEIGYPQTKDFKPQVLANEEKTRAFAVYNKFGTITLTEIDLADGAAGKSWELPKEFVQLIKVKGNHIYFLYQDSMYDPVKKLFKFEM